MGGGWYSAASHYSRNRKNLCKMLIFRSLEIFLNAKNASWRKGKDCMKARGQKNHSGGSEKISFRREVLFCTLAACMQNLHTK
jgi:hypothetical protein